MQNLSLLERVCKTSHDLSRCAKLLIVRRFCAAWSDRPGDIDTRHLRSVSEELAPNLEKVWNCFNTFYSTREYSYGFNQV